ncbi:MAG: PilT/PilU family type 4a pilus ATPase [bacterium]|nr:PilT/PilU family type 4a pilus ATPase [bacterium]
MWLDDLLSRARSGGASDLLLAVGAPPTLRIDNRLERLGEKPLDAEGTATLGAALVPSVRRDELGQRGAVDFSIQRPGIGRFRCNVHRERDRWAAAVRVFPDAPPELDSLNLPPSLASFADLEYGLVLVTGPTGCGKSTTLAAILRRILSRRRVHLVTIEDPVEYEHAHEGSLVEHIEIGRDVPSFAHALRSVLRQDPDVVLIGEMRDPESMAIAISAGETGHLVLSTLHTGDAPQTVHRILDSFPANQMEAIRAQLSVSLAGIISQQLLPRIDEPGRVPAVEVMMATPAVRNLVRQGKIEQLRSQITLGRSIGMLELDRSLAELVRRGVVDEREARARARVPNEFNAKAPRTASD